MKKFELPCLDRCKSFYGKATVTERNGAVILTSYNTEVCGIINGEFQRYWNGESTTTTRHVNSFLKLYNMDGGGLAWWRQQPVTTFNWIDFYIGTPITA